MEIIDQVNKIIQLELDLAENIIQKKKDYLKVVKNTRHEFLK